LRSRTFAAPSTWTSAKPQVAAGADYTPRHRSADSAHHHHTHIARVASKSGILHGSINKSARVPPQCAAVR
jgi:hypothetical protein